MEPFTVVEVVIWIALVSLGYPGLILRNVLRFYWWFNGLSDVERKAHPNAVSVLHIVFLTDVVQSMLFPTIVDMCHFVIFNDRVFLSWITAVHHLGAAVGGVLAWAVSYCQMEQYFHRVPKYASVLLTLHVLYFMRVLQMNSMYHHVLWHGIYYVIYSFHQIAVFNTLVSSVGKRATGNYLTLSSAVAKLGNVTGPATLIMVSTLDATSFAHFNAPFRLKNSEIAYMVVIALSLVRVTYTFALTNPNGKTLHDELEEPVSPVPPLAEEKLALANSLSGPENVEYDGDSMNERYAILPYVIFATNVMSLIGAGLSIRYMFLFLILKFNMEYRLMWLANMCIPIASTAALFVIDKHARRYGKLVTIFVTQLLALILLYVFIKVDDPKMVLVVYVLRATFQNTPMALKTTVMLRHSKEGSNGFWLASEQFSRIILFVSTILGGHISNHAGLEYCFLATTAFYGMSLLLLLPFAVLFPSV